jgi:hypothetical protein
MDDAFTVSGVQGVGDFDTESKDQIKVERPASHVFSERCTFEKLHRDKGLPVFFADIVDRADVWMI